MISRLHIEKHNRTRPISIITKLIVDLLCTLALGPLAIGFGKGLGFAATGLGDKRGGLGLGGVGLAGGVLPGEVTCMEGTGSGMLGGLDLVGLSRRGGLCGRLN